MGFVQNTIFCTITLFFLSVFDVYDAKECTNSPTQSKTLRYQILTSSNETWKQEMLSHAYAHDHHHHHHHLGHDHLTPTDEYAWSTLFPRKMLNKDGDEYSWNVMYKKIKYPQHYMSDANFLREVSLHDVRLDPQSLHRRAQQTNLEYLLILDVDNLVWSFRKTAGLATPGSPYGGWEAPNVELRGHFVGHYMSATAQMWASTHNEALKAKMTALVSALKECQDKVGTGYLSAFPSELFDRFEAIKPVWAPYYTIHKIMAGLLDQYNLVGNSDALKMVTWMANYFYMRVQNVIKQYSIERHWLSLNEETGGMNDVLYRLYIVTGDQKHLVLAHLFDKPCFLGILAMKADHISGFHTNTHIPIVIGAQMRYEITGDELYKEIGTFFMEVVNSTHSFATGGTSVNEFWADPKRLGDKLHTEDEESCTTYNMLKVSRNLFRWTKEITYADYYERALTNGVLSIQRGTNPGVMIYMLPLGHGVSKGRSYHSWGNQFNSFWCCYGTGIESFSKLGDSIYFEEMGKQPSLYVIQYISSSLNWSSAKISLTQNVNDVVSWGQGLKVTVKVTATTGSGAATLNLRIPSWTSANGLNASLNGSPISLPNPGNFLSITKSWSSRDEITMEFPMSIRTEVIQDDRHEFASLEAILYGPYLLAGLSNGDYDIQTGPSKSTSDWITPIPGDYNSQLVSLSQKVGDKEFFLANQDETITLEGSPQAGNDSYVHSTFRYILKDPSETKTKISAPDSVIGKLVTFEPFDLPGMVVAPKSTGEGLVVNSGDDEKGSSEFLIVKGLSGEDGTVSLKTQDGCFVYTSGVDVKLSCDSEAQSLHDELKKAASFVWNKGLKEYHPISFVAKGVRRSYVLEPLLGLRDETYNVYFNITKEKDT